MLFRSALARTDAGFVADVKAAAVLDSRPWAGTLLLMFALVMGSAYLWASNAVLDEVTIGTGRVIPSSKEQIIQSLEGGILAELKVKEGDVVSILPALAGGA